MVTNYVKITYKFAHGASERGIVFYDDSSPEGRARGFRELEAQIAQHALARQVLLAFWREDSDLQTRLSRHKPTVVGEVPTRGKPKPAEVAA